MSWTHAKAKYPKLKPFKDSDKDGVPNFLDCFPFDKTRHMTKVGQWVTINKGKEDFYVQRRGSPQHLGTVFTEKTAPKRGYRHVVPKYHMGIRVKREEHTMSPQLIKMGIETAKAKGHFKQRSRGTLQQGIVQQDVKDIELSP
mgnify:CR=1 FL=1